MSDFDFFDNWNKTLRWISFLPVLAIVYFIVYLFGKYAFWYGFGWMGMDTESGIGFLIYHFYLSFGCVYFPIVMSASCAPKGKVIIASIYTGIIVLLLGFSTAVLFLLGDSRPIWQNLYDFILNVAGAILALVAIIHDKKKRDDWLVNDEVIHTP